MFAYKKRHKQKRQICKCISCDDIVIMSLTVTDIDKITLKHLYIEMIAFLKLLYIIHNTFNNGKDPLTTTDISRVKARAVLLLVCLYQCWRGLWSTKPPRHFTVTNIFSFLDKHIQLVHSRIINSYCMPLGTNCRHPPSHYSSPPGSLMPRCPCPICPYVDPPLIHGSGKGAKAFVLAFLQKCVSWKWVSACWLGEGLVVVLRLVVILNQIIVCLFAFLSFSMHTGVLCQPDKSATS